MRIMMPLEIRSGLRKLEFQGVHLSGDDEDERVLVEFVSPNRLDATQTVCISLGVRDGVVRQLIGTPVLVKEQPGKSGVEYYYRLQGSVAKEGSGR
jgi:hypothetical protein